MTRVSASGPGDRCRPTVRITTKAEAHISSVRASETADAGALALALAHGPHLGCHAHNPINAGRPPNVREPRPIRMIATPMSIKGDTCQTKEQVPAGLVVKTTPLSVDAAVDRLRR